MSRLPLVVLALAALAAACDRPAPSGPSATAPRLAVVKNSHTDFQTTIWGCGEWVDVQGTQHSVIAQGDSLQGAGRSHGHALFREFGTGVGLTTGSRYSFSEVFSYNGNWDYTESPPSGVARAFRTMRLVSRDTMPDLVEHYTMHVTVTPDGDVVVNRSDFSSECR